jgi:hypothetical protein
MRTAIAFVLCMLTSLVHAQPFRMAADAWIARSTTARPTNHPTWEQTYSALNKTYGQWRVPCVTYDSVRLRYFSQHVRPFLKQRRADRRQLDEFWKLTNLPSTGTISGPVRACIE